MAGVNPPALGRVGEAVSVGEHQLPEPLSQLGQFFGGQPGRRTGTQRRLAPLRWVGVARSQRINFAISYWTNTRSNSAAARARCSSGCTTSQDCFTVFMRHGRSFFDDVGASSTKPYLASCRRWNEQFACDSPTSSAQRVEVQPLRPAGRPSRPTSRGGPRPASPPGLRSHLGAVLGPLPFARVYSCNLRCQGTLLDNQVDGGRPWSVRLRRNRYGARSGCEDNDRDHTRGLPRAFSELRVALGRPRKEALALAPVASLARRRSFRHRPRSVVIGCVLEVVVPVRVFGRSSVGGPDEEAFALGQVCDRVDSAHT